MASISDQSIGFIRARQAFERPGIILMSAEARLKNVEKWVKYSNDILMRCIMQIWSGVSLHDGRCAARSAAHCRPLFRLFVCLFFFSCFIYLFSFLFLCATFWRRARASCSVDLLLFAARTKSAATIAVSGFCCCANGASFPNCRAGAALAALVLYTLHSVYFFNSTSTAVIRHQVGKFPRARTDCDPLQPPK